MVGHEAGKDTPAISAEVLHAALQASQMATGSVDENGKAVGFGREAGHGMGDFTLKDVQDLLNDLQVKL